MATGPCAGTRALLAVGLLCAVARAQVLPVQEMGRSYTHIQPFNRGVLGNMRGAQAPMDVSISRKQAFIVTIKLGTPAQEFRCLLDSGSSDLWVPSIRCATCGTPHHFNAGASRTFGFTQASTPWGSGPKSVKITYGSGEIVGYDVRDVLNFGGVVLRDQPFILVNKAALPGGRLWDGICGLGWEQIAQVHPPLYRKVQAAGYPALFSLVPTGQHDAELIVGRMPNAEMLPSTLVWAAAEWAPTPGAYGSRRTFWVTTGGLAINRVNPVPAKFLVDTGTNQVLLAPRSRYNSFMSSLFPHQVFSRYCGMDKRAGMVVCDCRIASARFMRPLRIYLGNAVKSAFPLTVAELFVQVPARGGGKLCLLQIQPNSMGGASSMPAMLRGGLGGLLGNLLGGIFGSGTRAIALGGGNPFVNQKVIDLPGDEDAPEVQEILDEEPNGTICNTTRFVSGGKVRGEETHCTGDGDDDPAPANASRQLQTSDSEMWMIGGVFMKYYITIFDFDHAKMGFARPRRQVAPPNFLGRDQVFEMGPLPWDLRGWDEHTAVMRLLVLPALGCVAACGAVLLALLAGRKLLWRRRAAADVLNGGSTDAAAE